MNVFYPRFSYKVRTNSLWCPLYKKNLQKANGSPVYIIFCQLYSGIKLVEQQKIDITEESTTSVPTAKTSKKENTDQGNILETKKGKDQDNASGQELEDLKGEDLKDNETVS
jgi:hypothetical protein